MKLFLGSDHAGFHLKEKVFAYLSKREYDVEDVGDKELDPEDDFPEFAQRVVIKILGEDDARGILICGSGQGMCMAANRFHGIRASLVWDEAEAKLTRNDNDSNVLCLPARVIGDDDQQWQAIVDAWLNTPFAGAARYVRRNRQLDELA
jgi:ribose 5-phosphate isomerase B